MLFTAMGNDDPTMYRSFIVEVMAALMTPEVTKDFEHYYQKNAGRLLKNLHVFFLIVEGEDFDTYLHWLYLSRYSGSMTQKELDELRGIYGPKIKQTR